MILTASPGTLLVAITLFLLGAAAIWLGLGRGLKLSPRTTHWMALANGLLALAMLLALLRDVLPDALSVHGHDLLALAGLAAHWLTLPTIEGRQPPKRLALILLGLAALSLLAVPTDSTARAVLSMAWRCLFCALACAAAVRQLRRHVKTWLAVALALPFGALALMMALRAIQALLDPAPSPWLTSPLPQNIVMLWFILILVLIINSTVAFIVLMKLIVHIQRLSRHDPLTDALNRRALFEALAAQAQGVKRGRVYSLVVTDLDHFKRLNDTLGHPAGDRALVQVVKTLRQSLRELDQLGRIGGEEFVALLPLTDTAGALAAAERMRAAVAAQPLVWEATEWPLTASFGVSAARVEDDAVEAVLARADHALYAAKAAGRNCVRGDSG